jgi:hypothetical protein
MSLQSDKIAEQRPTYLRRLSSSERRQTRITAFNSSASLQKLKAQKGTLEAAIEVSAASRAVQSFR